MASYSCSITLEHAVAMDLPLVVWYCRRCRAFCSPPGLCLPLEKGGGGGHGKAWTELACAAVGGSRSTSFAGHARAGFWLVLTDAVHAPRRTSRTAGGSWFISDDSEPQRPIHEFYCSSLQCFPTMEAAGREGKSERASCGGARSGGGASAMQSKLNKKQVMIQSP